jgi:hypothetical protein
MDATTSSAAPPTAQMTIAVRRPNDGLSGVR